MHAVTQAASSGALQEEERDRVDAWRVWLCEEWGTRPGGMYRWLKEEGFSPPVLFVVRADGSPTSKQWASCCGARGGPSTASMRGALEPCPEAFVATSTCCTRCPC